MIDRVQSSRALIWRLILRDIRVRYRQSVLGYAWAVLPTLATVATFTFLKASRALPLGETPTPYMAYAAWGTSLWQLFSACLISATGSLALSGSLASKINFPKESLVIASVGAPLFDFLVRLVPIALVFVLCGVPFKWQFLLLPIVVASIIPLCLGLGFVLAIINLALRDIANALGVVLTLGMFLTPVLYYPPLEWPYIVLQFLNPVSPVLIASQDLIAYGAMTMPGAFLYSLICSLLFGLMGWRFFNLALPRLIHLV